MIPTDCYALCALAILTTFEIRPDRASFSRNYLVPCCLRVSKPRFFMQTWNAWFFTLGIMKLNRVGLFSSNNPPKNLSFFEVVSLFNYQGSRSGIKPLSSWPDGSFQTASANTILPKMFSIVNTFFVISLLFWVYYFKFLTIYPI